MHGLNWGIVSLAVISCAGCPPRQNPNDAGSTAPTVVSFSASPNSVSYGGGTATLSWTVTGATDLSIDQGVGDVTGKTSTQVPVATDITFTLMAANSVGSVEAKASVIVLATEDVNGSVLFSEGTFAVSNVTVSIPGHPPVITDADGGFRITNVTPPYDIIAGGPTPSTDWAVVYKHVTRSNPILVAFDYPAKLEEGSATIYGILDGGSNAPYSLAVALFGGTNEGSGFLFSDLSGAFAEPVRFSASETTGSLFGVEIVVLTDGGIGYNYGRADNITLLGGDVLDAGTLYIEPVPSGLLTAALVLPAPYAPGEGAEGIFFAHGAGLSFGPALPPTAPDLLLPNVPGATFFVELGTALGSIYSTPYNQEGVHFRRTAPAQSSVALDLTVAEAPHALSPVDGGTDINNSTPFSWTAFDGGVHRLSLSTSSLQLSVVTADTSVTLPDLTPVGVSYPSDAGFSWRVIGYSPYGSMDDFAATSTMDDTGATQSFGLGISVLQTFTTSP